MSEPVTQPSNNTNKLSPDDRKKLREELIARYSKEELKTLAFDVGPDYDSLPHDTKEVLARELVAACEREPQHLLLYKLLISILNQVHNPNVVAQILEDLPESQVPLLVSVQRYIRVVQQRFKEYYGDPDYIVPLDTKPGNHGPANSKPVNPKYSGSLSRSIDKFKLLYSTKPKLDFDINLQPLTPNKDNPLVDVKAYLETNTRVVLLGAPGAGKSTTIHDLFHKYAEPFQRVVPYQLTADTNGNNIINPVPIFAQLNQWQLKPQTNLVEFLQQELQNYNAYKLAEHLPKLVEHGQVVLLLDGLNELPSIERDLKTGTLNKDNRIKAIAELGNIAQWQPQVKCILSCRIKDFIGGPNWHDLHVLDLTREQIEAIVRSHYANNETLVTGLIRELYESQNKRKSRLQELYCQPFYLVKLLAYYSSNDPPQPIPENPARLLQFSVEEAVEREMHEKPTMQQMEADDLSVRLAYLAFNMTEAQKVSITNDKKTLTNWCFHIQNSNLQSVGRRQEDGVAIASYVATRKPKEIEETTRNDEYIEQLLILAENANILIINKDIVQFQHQLLQEYFTAFYCSHTLSAKFGNGFESAFLETISRHQFNEVWKLWAGLDEELVAKLSTTMQKHQNINIRSSAANALGRLGDSRAVEPLINALSDPDWFVRNSIIDTLGKLGKVVIEPLIVTYNDPKRKE
jgi:predicted NACHT family NTPase